MIDKVAPIDKINMKHAYLIMAHKDDECLHALLGLLDDPRNDIFIHMDLKNRDWNPEVLLSRLKMSSVFLVPRLDVTWGGYSQIVCELSLLQAATSEGHYAFYHLLSGQDLPIQNQDTIHSFFNAHQGVEFVRYAAQPINCLERVYGHILWNRFGVNRKQKVLLRFDKLISKIVRLLRPREDRVEYQKGDNWFSIGDSFARYVLSKKAWIEETFCNSFCCDEVFLQTLLWNSSFRSKVFCRNGEDNRDGIQRLIDWDRGNPYCFTSSDLSMLKESSLMFARKFDCSTDSGVIQEIVSLYGVDAQLK